MAHTTEQSDQPACCEPFDAEWAHLETLALHAGTGPDPATGALLTPIYQTTTFVQEAVGVHKGFTYSRAGNP
ncbi:PLP-dependent transferase, partial [Escherichia coli]|nr:PLP-dependent transferase [Escherichia coli]